MNKIEKVKILRKITKAGVSDCNKALEESGMDMEKAKAVLNRMGHELVSSISPRSTPQGFVSSYVHHNRKVGVIVEIRCETDFAIASLRAFAKDICLQIAATNPDYVSANDIPLETRLELERGFLRDIVRPGQTKDEMAISLLDLRIKKYRAECCLMDQKSVRDGSLTIEDLLAAKSNELHEKIVIKRFSRFQIE
jgi:elongation factor Ts